jgi:hypothetical protein
MAGHYRALAGSDKSFELDQRLFGTVTNYAVRNPNCVRSCAVAPSARRAMGAPIRLR